MKKGKQRKQASPHKPFLQRLIILSITGVVSLICSLAIIHDYSVYQSYVQGSCAITSTRVDTPTRSSGGYKGYYEVTVSTVSGRTYASLVSSGSYDTYDEAYTALSQYQVGTIYQCWYNPANPNRAGLNHNRYSFGAALVFTILAFIG